MVPDMALCIQTELKEKREDYVLLCMRDDKEKNNCMRTADPKFELLKVVYSIKENGRTDA